MTERIEVEKQGDWSFNYGYIIGTTGLLVALCSLYYEKKDDKRETEKLVEPPNSNLR